MEVLKNIAEELFGDEFKVKTYSNAISITAKDKSRAFCFGLTGSGGTFRVREKMYALKRFEEVEKILQPLLKKHKVGQGDFEMGVYGVDFKSTIKKVALISETPDIDSDFIDTYTDIDTGDTVMIRHVLNQFQKAMLFQEQEFINMYNTLQQVYEGLEQMTPRERGEFLGLPGPIRRLVIDTFCDPSIDLDSTYTGSIARYKIDAEGYHPVFKNWDKVVEDLYIHFKGTVK